MSAPPRFRWRPCEAAIILGGVALLRERGGWWSTPQASAGASALRRRWTRGAGRLGLRPRRPTAAMNPPVRGKRRGPPAIGPTPDFRLSAPRHADAAERLSRQALHASQAFTPRVLTVDTHAASPLAFDALLHDGTLPETCPLRPCQYVNTMAVAESTFLKRLAAAVRSRTAAKGDSTTFVVRRWRQCSRGNW